MLAHHSKFVTREIHCALTSASAAIVAPAGARNRVQPRYCTSAIGTMLTAGVSNGHHCRSFQSTQNDQSPASSMLLTWAAPMMSRKMTTEKSRSNRRSKTGSPSFIGGLAQLDRARQRLEPDREYAAEQIREHDERPVQRCREHLLGLP